MGAGVLGVACPTSSVVAEIVRAALAVEMAATHLIISPWFFVISLWLFVTSLTTFCK
jgi:hypothetical protein